LSPSLSVVLRKIKPTKKHVSPIRRESHEKANEVCPVRSLPLRHRFVRWEERREQQPGGSVESNEHSGDDDRLDGNFHPHGWQWFVHGYCDGDYDADGRFAFCDAVNTDEYADRNEDGNVHCDEHEDRDRYGDRDFDFVCGHSQHLLRCEWIVQRDDAGRSDLHRCL